MKITGADPSSPLGGHSPPHGVNIDETRSQVSEDSMDVTTAKLKLKGLILRTHQKSKDERPALGPLMDERSRAAMDDLLDAQAKLLECQEHLTIQQRRMRDLDANRSKLEEALAQAESELRLEAFLPLGKPRLIEEHLAGLRKEHALVEEELSAQTKAVDNTQTHILHYENEALRADGNIRISKPAQGPDLTKQALEREEEEAIASMRVEAERRGANHLRGLETERAVLRDEKLKEVEVKIAKQIDVAAKSHRTALARILETERERRKWVGVMVEKEEQKHQDRVDAILELKANTEKAAADIRGRNEKAEKLRVAKQRAHEKEKQALVEAGHNPYVVFKQRDIDRDAVRRKAELEARILSRQEAMASKIIRDMDYERKEADTAAADKEYERLQREQLGRHVIEEANRQYLIERTTAKVDIIDPTGRALRLDPSQVTTMVDGAFGLGYHPRKDSEQMGQVLELVRSNPAFQDVNLGEFARLLPKQVEDEEVKGFSQDSEGGPAWLDAFLTPKKATPGQELVDELATQDASQEGGISGHDEDSSLQQSSQPGIGVPREMSQFELDCLEKARRLRQERLEHGTPQVVGNRLFQGPAFVCRPDVMEFKDFIINKPHKKRLQLTNVSLAFNRFKLRDLPDDIRDFFDISYERPGRMCPGLTCAIDIIFTPRVRADIRSSLSLLTETGPISIPLVCTYPRVVPSLDTTRVTFDNVVKGEKASFNLTIRNDGALPTSYTITSRDGAGLKRTAIVAAALPLSPTTASKPAVAEGDSPTTGDEAVSGAGNCAEGVSTELELVELAARKRLEWLKGAKKGGGIFRLQDGGLVAPYSRVTHAITFAPVDVGTFCSRYLVSFTDCDAAEGVIELELHGTATHVPIHIPDSLHDLRCCVYDKLYRKDVVVNNRGKIAYKVQTIVPKQLQGMLDFSPTMGFVQPGGDFLLQMKFKPDEATLLKQGGKYLLKKEDGSVVMAVPVQVGVPNQVVSLFFTLKAQLTAGTIRLSKHAIHFGDCFTSESYKTVVQIKNQSHLPQKVGCLAVPSCILVKPNDGFITLLPQESQSLEVSFSPTSATRHDLSLIVRTSLNQTIRLHVTAQGLEPPALLSHSVLRLPPACPGDMVSHNLLISNRSKAEQVFEFSVPHPSRSHLRLAPVVASLPPGGSRRITLWFCPPADQNEDTCPSADASLPPRVKAPSDTNSEGMEGSSDSGQPAGMQLMSGTRASQGQSTPSKLGPAKSAKATKQAPQGHVPAAAVTPTMPLAMLPELLPEEGTVCYSLQTEPEKHEELDPEVWSRHARWFLPCFIQSLSPAPAADPPVGAKNRFVTLQVHTTTVQRDLELEPTSINFGELAVGQKKVVAVRIRNQSCVQAGLEVVRGLSACGNFSVLNSVRPVPAEGGIRTLLIQFLPVTHGILTEVMLLHSPNLGKDLYIKLQGEGVNTALQLTPEDGRLDMGQVLEGRSITQTITLRNTSPFSLRFEIRPLAASHENFTHHLPIQCLPSEATIAPGESTAVEMTFSPDHARIWSYEQAFQVVVPGQTEKQFLQVRGRSWRRQLYVHAAEPEDDTEQRVSRTQEDPLALPPSLETLENASTKTLSLSRSPLHDIRLRFPRELGQSQQAVTRRIIVGSAAMPGGGSSAGTFEVELGEEAKKAGATTSLFSVTPDKGPVAPDARIELVFTYKPMVQEKPAGGLIVGQWVKYPFKIHLKGGYRPHPTDAEVVSVDGILEAFMYV